MDRRPGADRPRPLLPQPGRRRACGAHAAVRGPGPLVRVRDGALPGHGRRRGGGGDGRRRRDVLRRPSAGAPSLPVAFATGLGFLLVKNLLEEFIFRGYGTRTAMALGLRGVAPHLLVGLVWGLWHLPLYTVWMSQEDFRRTTSLPWAWYLPLFFAGIMALAVLYGEMRVRTGSIWPGVVLHTVNNALVNPLLLNGHLSYRGNGDVLFGVAPNSLASVLVFGGVGLVLLRRRRRSGGRPGSERGPPSGE
nr:hypothetical protein GCM10020093_063140 [Planobispora longispora]